MLCFICFKNVSYIWSSLSDSGALMSKSFKGGEKEEEGQLAINLQVNGMD